MVGDNGKYARQNREAAPAGESAPDGAAAQAARKAYARECVATAIAIAARAYDISRDQVLAPRRCRAHIAEGRQVAMYLAHVIGQVAPTDAAPHFRRDRTTIAHACSKIEDQRDDTYFDNGLALLEQEMLDRVGELKLERLRREQAGESDPMLVRTASGRFYRFEALPDRRDG